MEAPRPEEGDMALEICGAGSLHLTEPVGNPEGATFDTAISTRGGFFREEGLVSGYWCDSTHQDHSGQFFRYSLAVN